MLTDTGGNIEFESSPASTGNDFPFKITPINTARSIVIMMAGAMDIQAQIVLRMIRLIEAYEKQSPPKHLSVEEAVNLYVDLYNQEKSQRAASAILAPFGLEHGTFIARQKEMLDSFSDMIARELLNFQLPPTETIITGVDISGAHLFKLTGNHPACCDAFGFAAIGGGAFHAESQLMLNGYSRVFPQEEAFWMIYTAKRKAEIAPGVGKATDLFCVTPGANKTSPKFRFLNDIIEKIELERIYDAFVKKQLGAFQEAQLGMKPLMEKVVQEFKKLPATTV
jgi:hypothetical protein